MAKRVDQGHDSTQELSASQLLTNAPPARPQGGAQNDVSMWMRTVVSSDDFATATPRAASRRSGPVVAIVVLALGAAAGGYVWLSRGTDEPAPAASAPAMTSASPVPAAPPAPLAPAAPAVPALAASSLDAMPAATADAGIDAAVAPAAESEVVADAISSVGPVIKKAPLKKTKKKPKKTVRKRVAPKRRAK